MPVMTRIGRVDFDEAEIMVASDYKYPKKISVKDGSSMSYWLDNNTIFKGKPADGNRGWNPVDSLHHHVYDEYAGSFDDLAEVMAYTLAKNMGTRTKTMYDGTKKEVPLVDVAYYDLAMMLDRKETEIRGCVTKNIVPIGSPRNMLIKGATLLEKAFPSVNREMNSIPHYITAVQKYAEQQSQMTGRNVIVDPNLKNDLIINSYFCWKIGNVDNHSSNITYLQQEMPDGSLLLSVSTLIDNGAAWGLNTSQKEQNPKTDYERLTFVEKTIFNAGGVISNNANGNPMAVFNKDPFKHTAFYLYAGSLNGHNKQIGDEKFAYEFDLAANMLSNPEVYDAIYQIEQQFDMDKALSQVAREKYVTYPNLLPETMRGLTEFKSNLLSQVVSNYYCYTAFTSCVGEVDLENPSELYTTFCEQMSALPLQPNVESYMNEFLNIASQNQVEVDPELLATVEFMPKPEQTQNMDTTQGSAQ